MLKYLNNNKDCNNSKDKKKGEKEFDLLKCNKALYNKVSRNKLLRYRRCIFMTFDEYTSEKVHINNNMCCRVFDSVNETELKNTIQAELENIRGNLLRPSYLKIPLPIYVMLAKKLETVNKEDVFIGLVEVAKENWSFGNGEMQYEPK
jgi:anaerobic ribonucleoside-triphosphate reductase